MGEIMKTKIMSILLICLIAFMAVEVSARPVAPACQPSQVIGDYDNDMDVDFQDVWNLLSYTQGSYTFAGDTSCYDINRDGFVNFQDFVVADDLFIGRHAHNDVLGLVGYPSKYVLDCQGSDPLKQGKATALGLADYLTGRTGSQNRFYTQFKNMSKTRSCSVLDMNHNGRLDLGDVLLLSR